MSSSIRHASITLAVLAALAASTVSCNRYTRTKQCRALIAQINPALDDVLTVTHRNPDAGTGSAVNAAAGGASGTSAAGAGGAASNSGSYVAAAGRYERLAKQLGPMEFASEDMAKNVAEYVGILNSAAQTLRSLATALDSNDSGEADKLNRELDRIGSRERAVVGRMDAWCQP